MVEDTFFLDDFNKFVKKRADAGLIVSPALPDYYEYLVKIDKLKDNLLKLTDLDPDDRKIIERLPKIVAKAGKITAAAAYIQGLRDMQSITDILQDINTYA